MVRALGHAQEGRGSLSKMSEEDLGWFDRGEGLGNFNDVAQDGSDHVLEEEEEFGDNGGALGFDVVANQGS